MYSPVVSLPYHVRIYVFMSARLSVNVPVDQSLSSWRIGVMSVCLCLFLHLLTTYLSIQQPPDVPTQTSRDVLYGRNDQQEKERTTSPRDAREGHSRNALQTGRQRKGILVCVYLSLSVHALTPMTSSVGLRVERASCHRAPQHQKTRIRTD